MQVIKSSPDASLYKRNYHTFKATYFENPSSTPSERAAIAAHYLQDITMAAPNLVEHYEDCLEDDEDYIIVDIDAETGLPILKDEYIYALHAFLDELNIMRSLQSLRNARFESPNHEGKGLANFELKQGDRVDGAGSISKLQKAADIEKEQTGLAAAPYARATAIREKNKRARSHTDPDFIKSDAVSDCTNTSWI